MSDSPSLEEVAATVQAAIRSDLGYDQEPAVTPSSPVEAVTPDPTPTPTPAVEESFVPRADLEALLTGVEDPAARERIQQAYKSFQGGYTRKTQELAEQRKLYEQFGPTEDVQSAVELYQALQNPLNWQSIHAQLSENMQAYGLSPAQAEQAATQQMQAAAEPEFVGDPDEEPFINYITSLEDRINQLQSAQDDRVNEEKAQRLSQAVLGELNRQEAYIRENHPQYKQEDIDAIYEWSSFYDGNLIDAQARYEQDFNRRLGGYLDTKGSVFNTPGIAPLPGAGVDSVVPVGPPKDFRQAEKDAIAYLRSIQQAEA